MTNLTIKSVPRDLYERLKASAAESRRSLNSEVIRRLEQSVGVAPIDPGALLHQVRAVRERAAMPYLTDEALRAAREDGRS